MVDGAALAYFFGYFSVFVLIVLFFSIKNKSNPFQAETYIDVPKGFEIDDKYIFESQPKSIDELMDVSKDVILFTEQFDNDKNRQNAISLAIEELGTIILENGAGEKKKYIFEMRLVYDEEKKSWILRTRDSCQEFNPVKYLEMHDIGSEDKLLGLKIVMNMAKRAEYYNTMGLNNLVVEF